MNTSAHRLIWSKSKGSIMAVAETASSSGKRASGNAGPRSSRARTKVFIQPFQVSDVPVAQGVRAEVAMNPVASNPSARYLIETNPRFTSYKNWLGSGNPQNAAPAKARACSKAKAKAPEAAASWQATTSASAR